MVDAPRVNHIQGMEGYVEDGIPRETVSALRQKGHDITQDNPSIN
jgi:gamma-glutamyltranspeptidase